jgi:uncharacterized membrane protein YqaE (UPF0057 family)
MNIIRILISIFLPPLGIFLKVGIGFHFWLNIILTICGYFPGVIHAVYIIGVKSSKNEAASTIVDSASD